MNYRKAKFTFPDAPFLSSRCQSPSSRASLPPSRAQNRVFCALLPSGTLVFRHFEHKIEVFVLFWPPEPLFSSISSTKSRFLCAFALQNPHLRVFREQNRGFCALADSIGNWVPVSGWTAAWPGVVVGCRYVVVIGLSTRH